MKLPSSIRREAALLSRGIYFYSEIAIAALCLIALLAFVPERFDARQTEYIHFAMPEESAAAAEAELASGAETRIEETVEVGGREIAVRRIETGERIAIVVDGLEDFEALCEATGRFGAVVREPSEANSRTLYLQGYEARRYRNLATILTDSGDPSVAEAARTLRVTALDPNAEALSDRQALLPMMLATNCAIMGVLAAAAMFLEDKQTRAVIAIRVAPARLGTYYCAKIVAVVATSVVTAIIIAAPIIRARANYPLLILGVASGSFLCASIGALIASFYEDIGGAFAAVYLTLIAMLIPGVTGMIPTLSAPWTYAIPSRYIVEGVEDALAGRAGAAGALRIAALAAGGVLLTWIAMRRSRPSRSARGAKQ